jgi:hypothetical protein
MLLNDAGLALNLSGLGSAGVPHLGMTNGADYQFHQLQQQSHHRHHM